MPYITDYKPYTPPATSLLTTPRRPTRYSSYQNLPSYNSSGTTRPLVESNYRNSSNNNYTPSYNNYNSYPAYENNVNNNSNHYANTLQNDPPGQYQTQNDYSKKPPIYYKSAPAYENGYPDGRSNNAAPNPSGYGSSNQRRYSRTGPTDFNGGNGGDASNTYFRRNSLECGGDRPNVRYIGASDNNSNYSAGNNPTGRALRRMGSKIDAYLNNSTNSGDSYPGNNSSNSVNNNSRLPPPYPAKNAMTNSYHEADSYPSSQQAQRWNYPSDPRGYSSQWNLSSQHPQDYYYYPPSNNNTVHSRHGGGNNYNSNGYDVGGTPYHETYDNNSGYSNHLTVPVVRDHTGASNTNATARAPSKSPKSGRKNKVVNISVSIPEDSSEEAVPIDLEPLVSNAKRLSNQQLVANIRKQYPKGSFSPPSQTGGNSAGEPVRFKYVAQPSENYGNSNNYSSTLPREQRNRWQQPSQYTNDYVRPASLRKPRETADKELDQIFDRINELKKFRLDDDSSTNGTNRNEDLYQATSTPRRYRVTESLGKPAGYGSSQYLNGSTDIPRDGSLSPYSKYMNKYGDRDTDDKASLRPTSNYNDTAGVDTTPTSPYRSKLLDKYNKSSTVEPEDLKPYTSRRARDYSDSIEPSSGDYKYKYRTRKGPSKPESDLLTPQPALKPYKSDYGHSLKVDDGYTPTSPRSTKDITPTSTSTVTPRKSSYLGEDYGTKVGDLSSSEKPKKWRLKIAQEGYDSVLTDSTPSSRRTGKDSASEKSKQLDETTPATLSTELDTSALEKSLAKLKQLRAERESMSEEGKPASLTEENGETTPSWRRKYSKDNVLDSPSAKSKIKDDDKELEEITSKNDYQSDTKEPTKSFDDKDNDDYAVSSRKHSTVIPEAPQLPDLASLSIASTSTGDVDAKDKEANDSRATSPEKIPLSDRRKCSTISSIVERKESNSPHKQGSPEKTKPSDNYELKNATKGGEGTPVKKTLHSQYPSDTIDKDDKITNGYYAPLTTEPRSSKDYSSRNESPTKLNTSAETTYIPWRDRLKADKLDDITEPSPECKGGLRGLANLGNTCFMNSIIQVLSNTKPLLDYVRHNDYLSEINDKSPHKGEIIKEFAQLMDELWGTEATTNRRLSIRPVNLKKKVELYAPSFSGYNQQDAQEFLVYLLSGFHDDLNQAPNKPAVSKRMSIESSTELSADVSWKKYQKTNKSKIVDVFGGQLKSILICDKCHNKSLAYDPFWNLSLPIDDITSPNLYDCLNNFVKEENLKGDDAPFCSRCDKRESSTKSFKIQRYPKILIIHLKRFAAQCKSGVESFTKIRTPVEFPFKGLDLHKYSSSPLADCDYDLYAITCHTGSISSGHYFSFCKNPANGKWHLFEDSRVEEIPQSEIDTHNAYLLFYQRQ